MKMVEENFRLIHKCELEYIDIDKTTKPKLIVVELLNHDGRSTIRLVKTEKPNKVILEINLDDVGGAVIVKLNRMKVKKSLRECLVLIWKEKNGDWKPVVIIDKERPAQLNCVRQLKSQLKIQPLNSVQCYEMSGEGEECQLQFWKKYISVLPGDCVKEVDAGNIPEFCKSLSSEFVFPKNPPGLKLAMNENESHPSSTSISFRTADNRNLLYNLCGGEESKTEVSKVFSSLKPLPPVPVENDERGSLSDANQHDCGRPPSMDDTPFWFYEGDIEETIYDHVDDAYKSVVISYEKRVRPRRFQRELSPRFKTFVDSVYIKPGMLELGEPTRTIHQKVYDRPRVSVYFAKEKEEPAIEEKTFPKDNVESTFGQVLKNILKYTFNQDSEPDCPFGMTRDEREVFCFRLDLNEFDSIQGQSWKTFATTIMVLDDDDLKMIEEFSSRYKCQVVEVVLEHWHKLHNMRSPKSLLPASKSTIIQVLRTMQRDSLLETLHWL